MYSFFNFRDIFQVPEICRSTDKGNNVTQVVSTLKYATCQVNLMTKYNNTSYHLWNPPLCWTSHYGLIYFIVILHTNSPRNTSLPLPMK